LSKRICIAAPVYPRQSQRTYNDPCGAHRGQPHPQSANRRHTSLRASPAARESLARSLSMSCRILTMTLCAASVAACVASITIWSRSAFSVTLTKPQKLMVEIAGYVACSHIFVLEGFHPKDTFAGRLGRMPRRAGTSMTWC
jgi:hypothetical protein